MEEPDTYYRVEFAEPFEADMDTIYLRLSRYSPVSASRWQDGLFRACFSLEQFPYRCPVAPESEDFEIEVRHLYYRNRGKVYQILFTIFAETKEESGTVRVLRIGHGKRQEGLTEAD